MPLTVALINRQNGARNGEAVRDGLNAKTRAGNNHFGADKNYSDKRDAGIFQFVLPGLLSGCWLMMLWSFEETKFLKLPPHKALLTLHKLVLKFSNFKRYQLFIIKVHSERWNLVLCFSPKPFSAFTTKNNFKV